MNSRTDYNVDKIIKYQFLFNVKQAYVKDVKKMLKTKF